MANLPNPPARPVPLPEGISKGPGAGIAGPGVGIPNPAGAAKPNGK